MIIVIKYIIDIIHCNEPSAALAFLADLFILVQHLLLVLCLALFLALGQDSVLDSLYICIKLIIILNILGGNSRAPTFKMKH